MPTVARIGPVRGSALRRLPRLGAVAVLLVVVLSNGAGLSGTPGHGRAVSPSGAFPVSSGTREVPAIHPSLLPSAGPPTNVSPPSWVNLSPSLGAAPSPRADASMAYDVGDQEFVLFGGYATAGGSCSPTSPCPLRDTWAFKNGAWTNVTPSVLSATNSPSARWGAAAAYDEADGYLVLFGGSNGTFAALGPNPFLNDTWTFHGGMWSELCAACSASGTPIAPRSDAGLAFDRASGTAVMFGGTVVASAIATGLTNQSLMFAAGTWSLLSTPVALSARSNAALAFDNQTRSVLLFGGYGGSGDTWSFSAGRWSHLTPSIAPSSRGGAALVLDPLNGSDLLFGGCAASGCAGGPDAETWEFTAGSWVNLTGQLVSAPAARATLAAASDPLGSTVLLVAGLSAAPVNDTFQWDQVRVTTPTVVPSPIDVGQSSQATTTAASPIGGLQYLWVGPQAGCFSANLPSDVCMPHAAGNFPVSVRVTDAAGLVVDSFVASLAVNPRPTASAQAAPTSGTTPLQVTFSATTAGGTAPFTFAWTFGDGSIGVGSNPAHTYLVGGVFAVELWANDSFGVSAQANLTVRTVAPFVTHLAVLPSIVVLGGTVTFYANASGGQGPYTENYSGLPPGCASRNASTVSCTPTTLGLYTVRVTFTDSTGLAQNLTGSVDVVAPIALRLTLSPVTVVVGQVFTVNASVTGGDGVNTVRYFGLPSSCTGNNRTLFTCRADVVGTFTVNATVMDSSGARARGSAVLTVLATPATSPAGGLSNLWVGVIIAVAVVAATLGLLLYRRRRKGPPIVPPPHANLPPPADLYVPPPSRPRP